MNQMRQIIHHPMAPAPVGPYNQAILSGNTLYVSGQIAINQETGALVLDSIEDETHQVMKNLSYILEAAGMSFENVVKCSVFVTDMGLYSRINAVYSTYFSDETAPARELVQVANLPKYVNVEVSCIAVK
jgi:2-iminobutanoate/2-iminopropanoate deaminase